MKPHGEALGRTLRRWLPDREAPLARGLGPSHVDGLYAGATRPAPAPLDYGLDAFVVSLERRLHRRVRRPHEEVSAARRGAQAVEELTVELLDRLEVLQDRRRDLVELVAALLRAEATSASARDSGPPRAKTARPAAPPPEAESHRRLSAVPADRGPMAA